MGTSVNVSVANNYPNYKRLLAMYLELRSPKSKMKLIDFMHHLTCHEGFCPDYIKYGKLFNIVKIKTMKPVVGVEMTITSSDDVRITKSGAFFRRTKIDELPQLWNVFIGQMSFVGPRPDVPGYADKLQGKNRIILSMRPGITGPAQLAYKDEERILANQNNAIEYNDEVIWPDKVKINREYVENYSFFKDIYYIWKTIVGGDVKY
jgi:lipopolysaccharide/colanic/teichoic acid biosynthesis glycosyltransferase